MRSVRRLGFALFVFSPALLMAVGTAASESGSTEGAYTYVTDPVRLAQAETEPTEEPAAAEEAPEGQEAATEEMADEPPVFTEEFLHDPTQIEAGKAVWETCAGCHGANAYPGKAPHLRPKKYTPEFVFDRVTNGYKNMPAWKDVFTKEERMDVVAWILSDDFAP